MNGRELLEARLLELDRLAYERNILKCTGFLSYDEQSEYHRLSRSGQFLSAKRLLWGGFPDAERAVALFLPDYMEEEEAEREAVGVIRAEAVNGRFAEELTHRDWLGALMNLGIERDCLGDILTDETGAAIFCRADMAEYIMENLLRVKHTSVRCRKEEASGLQLEPRLEELQINVASERADAVIAALYRLSRQKAADLCAAELVFINGMTVTSPGRQMKEGDRVSVRGFGKFLYDGIGGSSKKGRLFVTVRRFV